MTSISKLFATMLAIAIVSGVALLGQSERAMDLRYQIQPRLDELIDATQYSAVEDPEIPKEEPLLAITLRSLGPVSDSGTALAEAAFQNTGKGVFRFPVSLEMKLLHVQGSVDRRSLLCGAELFEANGGLFHQVAAFNTFMSSSDHNSFVELRPKDTLVLTFTVQFHALPTRVDWKAYLRSRSAQAGLACVQTVLRPITGRETERKYSSQTTNLRSANAVPVSLAP